MDDLQSRAAVADNLKSRFLPPATTDDWLDLLDAIDAACGSAWKRDPVSGVIGVEMGPLILVF